MFSWSFMVSGLTFKSLIHFEFISCVWYKKGVHFDSFASSGPIFPTPCIEEVVSSLLCVLASFIVD